MVIITAVLLIIKAALGWPRGRRKN